MITTQYRHRRSRTPIACDRGRRRGGSHCAADLRGTARWPVGRVEPSAHHYHADRRGARAAQGNCGHGRLEPVVHTSSRTSTCRPSPAWRRLQRELVEADGAVAQCIQGADQRGVGKRVHRAGDARTRGARRAVCSADGFYHPQRHRRADTAFVGRNGQPHQPIDDEAMPQPHPTHRTVLVITHQRAADLVPATA